MNILSVSELTLAIKKTLEPRFANLQVKGEVTNLRHQSSGHLYFSLKDQDSQISAVLFKGNARNISQLPKAGDQIIVRGELSLYAPRGSYQIIVRELEHAGVGALLLKLHELKTELQQKGWFNSELKKALPKYPKTIGVVTSPTGSVIQDILNVLKRRFPQFHLILNPVRVQGAEAAEEIAKAIRDFNTHKLVDILIVGRGGGSLEDLWPFNERCVAEAIFHSETPIISAVGHETDVTIADCVADIRAPTPSAAAEISVRELSSQLDFLTQTHVRITQSIKQTVKHSKALLEGVTRTPLFTSPYTLLSSHFQKVDDLSSSLDTKMQHQMHTQRLQLSSLEKQIQGLKPSNQVGKLKTELSAYSHAIQGTVNNQIGRLKEKLDIFKVRLNNATAALIENKKGRFLSRKFRSTLDQNALKLCMRRRENLHRLTAHLQAVNPQNILQKGYCIPFAEKDHSVMLSSNSLKEGMKLSLQFHDGSAITRVEEVAPSNNGSH